jgi:hypothetical protein
MVTRNVRHAGVYRAKRGKGIRTVRRAQVQLAPVERLANVALSKVGFLLVGERASAAKSSTATTFATASSKAAMRSLSISVMRPDFFAARQS